MKILVDVDVEITGPAPPRRSARRWRGAQLRVQSVVLANRRLFVLAAGQLRIGADRCRSRHASAPFTPNVGMGADAAGELGLGVDHRGRFQRLGPRGPAVLLRGASTTDAEGATAYRAAYRIAYELDDNGEPAYWGDEIEAPIPVTDIPPVVVLGPIDPQTTALRQATAAGVPRRRGRHPGAADQRDPGRGLPAAATLGRHRRHRGQPSARRRPGRRQCRRA